MVSELSAGAQRLLALAQRLPPTAEDTLVVADGAASLASAAGDLSLASVAERLAGRVAYAIGDLDRAECRLLRASQLARSVNDERSWARVELSLSFLAYDRGDTAAASAKLDEIERATRGGEHYPEVASFLHGYRGNLARQRGSFEQARAHYAAALSHAGSAAAAARATFAMDLGATELAAGHLDRARVWLRRAHELTQTLEPGPSRAQLLPLIAHYDALASLLGASPSSIELDGPTVLGEIRVWLHDATRGGRQTPRIDRALERRLARLDAAATRYEHARFGIGVLRSLLHARALVTSEVLVARDGSEIASGSRRADLRTRDPLRRIVAALLALDPHEALDVRALVACGWPGERIDPSAAKNRVHVALSTLRALGLGAALVRRDGGYALDRTKITVV